MIIRIAILPLFILTLLGCSKKSTTTTLKPLGGPYYQELTVIPEKWPPLMEPGNNNLLRYIYKNSDQKIEITRYLGGYGSTIYTQFAYRIYGSNFVYVEREGGSWSKFRLRAYSLKNGNITVNEKYEGFWKIIADTHGIICHRYQDGQERDDPQPVVYTAEYLSGL